MRIICEVCKQEGYLQRLGNYCRVRHYGGKAEYGKSKLFHHKQSRKYVKEQLGQSTSLNSQKGLIEIQYNGLAETGQGVQANIEHLKGLGTGLEQQNINVRDCPSLVGGRPAKSVVERPRGFKSHIPRQLTLSQFRRCLCTARYLLIK